MVGDNPTLAGDTREFLCLTVVQDLRGNTFNPLFTGALYKLIRSHAVLFGNLETEFRAVLCKVAEEICTRREA